MVVVVVVVRFVRYLQCYDVEQSEAGCPLSVKRCLTRTICRWCGRHRGNYLIITYTLVKCLYLVNVVGQLFLLDFFLGVPFHSYGIDAIRGIAQVTDSTYMLVACNVGLYTE